MTAIDQTELGGNRATENLARRYATEVLLSSPEAFGKYANQLIPLEAIDFDRIGVVQEAARRYNEEADNTRQVSLLFHFTDEDGAAGIVGTEMLGIPDGERTYLTPVTPELAKPLTTERLSWGILYYTSSSRYMG